MKIKVGDHILVKTKTIGDKFGNVCYKYIGKYNDKLSFEMQCGSGDWARKGVVIYDTPENLENGFKDGSIKLIDAATVDISRKDKDKKQKNRMAGIIELD